MKKFATILLSITLILGISTISPVPTDAAAQKFANCKELNKVYAGGVAKDAKVKNKGGKTKYKPTVSSEIYNLNSGKDRDKDGIACER
ncbi:excalibur calcium-binding domain-containing protein [Psychrobacillus sp.]|uniref:excalibur calcium-binding domain-containing protein n=1 Tax=Psychrobacillus sp. TaxID=1871623 RepID=UPI0028BE33E9|nr:excalibur calcium-binding domain-containing protein [Psychrobacillus sp.]